MARFGIRSPTVLGVPVPTLRKLARELGPDHPLSRALWDTGVFEARLLAAMIAEPSRLSGAEMDRWANDFDNWAVCDGCCQDLFCRSELAYGKALAWSRARPEFVRRAGFALVAKLAYHDRNRPDAWFVRYLKVIEHASPDDRLYVRKAVNWSLREIGKRSPSLRRHAIACALRIQRKGTRSGRWIASDALRELRSPATIARIRARGRAKKTGAQKAVSSSPRR
jgi:3-methyladenine DNA glycosylase AlkD